MIKKIPETLRFFYLLPLVLLYSCTNSEPAVAQPLKETPLLIKKIVVSQKDTVAMEFINDEALYREGWDTLAQPQFWKRVMCMSPDSAILNIAECRTPIEVLDFNRWMDQDEVQKNLYKQNVCCERELDAETNLFVTKGRKDFFEHRKSVQSINKAIQIFKENNVDPWYAQTILLIESPGKHVQKSWAGAQGPFQLMRDVAVKYGLKVNRTIDERTSLNRSAYAASQLINNMCIPKVQKILDSLQLSYEPTDTWFRLLVLHAYHAGPGNLGCALYSIAPEKGGMELIRQLWQTECRGFKNESQNYSQLALAAHLSFNEILGDGDTVFLVQGDELYANYQELQGVNQPLTIAQLDDCINTYGNDLIDGTIDAEHYIERVNRLKQRIALATPPTKENEYLTVGKELLRKKKVDDAIKVLKFTIEQYPESAMAADSLSRAYKISGNLPLAQKYEKLSNELSQGIAQ